MENQDIKWETWGEQPQDNNEQPQVNWGEPSQEENIPTWGEQPQQKEQPQVNWGEQPQQEEQPQVNWGEQPQQEEQPQSKWEYQPPSIEELPNYENLESKNFEKKTSYLGNFSKVQINTQVWKLNYNNSQVLQDLLQEKPQKIDNDGKYSLNPLPDSELADILTAIKKVGESQGLQIGNCYLLKNQPRESSINVIKDNPKSNFIYFLNASYNSGEIILDLSSLKGPSIKALDSDTGMLISIPGWVPYSITKNLSGDPMIAIVGTFI